jgi:hypothetical protein
MPLGSSSPDLLDPADPPVAIALHDCHEFAHGQVIYHSAEGRHSAWAMRTENTTNNPAHR